VSWEKLNVIKFDTHFMQDFLRCWKKTFQTILIFWIIKKDLEKLVRFGYSFSIYLQYCRPWLILSIIIFFRLLRYKRKVGHFSDWKSFHGSNLVNMRAEVL
jgi:hypothetical protein